MGVGFGGYVAGARCGGEAEMNTLCSSLAGSVFPARSARRIAAFNRSRISVMLIMEWFLFSCVFCFDGGTSTGEKFRNVSERF